MPWRLDDAADTQELSQVDAQVSAPSPAPPPHTHRFLNRFSPIPVAGGARVQVTPNGKVKCKMTVFLGCGLISTSSECGGRSGDKK